MVPKPKRLSCRVTSLRNATHDIRVLRMAPDEEFSFLAGQFVSVAFSNLEPRDYSLAGRPDEAELEFHIRNTGGDGASDYVANNLAVGDRVEVQGPYGVAWLRQDHEGPILAVAGGSGMAPMRSIVETALAAGMTQPIHLYFGARREQDIYLEDQLAELMSLHPNLSFVPVLSEPDAETTRRTGLVGDMVVADFEDFDGFKAYLAGPPIMVESTTALLSQRGLPSDDIHADPFYSEAEMQARGELRPDWSN